MITRQADYESVKFRRVSTDQVRGELGRRSRRPVFEISPFIVARSNNSLCQRSEMTREISREQVSV
jgi:hypothetical protein